MEKRYQVFISSTYEDLKEERAKVIQALWELDCIPYGMEVFPATSGTSWEWIEKAIKESDYYILIVGGKYGSIDKETGISYTQKEYEYAESINIPIIRFLVQDEQELPSKKTEQNPRIKGKLDEFIKSVKLKQCRFFTSPNNLMAQVSTSLQHLIKENPRNGWIRANGAVTDLSEKEINRLQKKIEQLELKLAKSKPSTLKSKEFPEGDNEFEIKYMYEYKTADSTDYINIEGSQMFTMGKIFYLLSFYFMDSDKGYYTYDSYTAPISEYLKNEMNKMLEKQNVEVIWDDLGLLTDMDDVMLYFMSINCVSRAYRGWKITNTGMKYIAPLREKYKNIEYYAS